MLQVMCKILAVLDQLMISEGFKSICRPKPFKSQQVKTVFSAFMTPKFFSDQGDGGLIIFRNILMTESMNWRM